MTEFTPIQSLLGGMLIGLAAVILWFGSGRIAGISGIVGGLLGRAGAVHGWRWLFAAGLVAGAALAYRVLPGVVLPQVQGSMLHLAVAGLLVGAGTRIGSGCTSGHGVCGLARGSMRSLVATCVFMLVAGITVYASRHLSWGAL